MFSLQRCELVRDTGDFGHFFVGAFPHPRHYPLEEAWYYLLKLANSLVHRHHSIVP